MSTPLPCTQPTAGPSAASSSSDNTVAIIGGVVAVVIVLIIAATTAVIVAVVLRYRRAEFSPNQSESQIQYITSSMF